MSAQSHAERQRTYREKQKRHVTIIWDKLLKLEADLDALRDLVTLSSRDSHPDGFPPKKGLPPAPPSKDNPSSLTLFPLSSLRSDIPQGEQTNGDEKHGKQKLGRPIPASWQPSEADRAFAAGLGLNASAIAPEFVDYWLAVPGQSGRKIDWSATFRNRCRKIVATGHVNGYSLDEVPIGRTTRGPAPKVSDEFIAEHPEIRRFYE